MFPLLTVQTALIGHTPRCQLSVQRKWDSISRSLPVQLFMTGAKQVLHFCSLLCEFLLFVWLALTEVSSCQYWVVLKGNMNCQVFMRSWVGTRAKSPPTPTYCVDISTNQSMGAVQSDDHVYSDFPMLAQEFHLEDPIHAARHNEPVVYAKHNYPSTWREIHLLSQCTGLAHREVNMNWVWLGVSILHYYRNNPQHYNCLV